MRFLIRLVVVLLLLALLLAGCGDNSAPPLAVENEPTLVYIYTEA